MGSITAEKLHAVLIPYPAQGHITPMLKVAKLLHSRGFHITFVNTEHNHGRLIKSRGPDAVKGLPDFRFETIPDGLPSCDLDSTQDIPSICESTSTKCLAPFRELVAKLNSRAAPPVTCIVSDAVMSFTLDVAEELGITDVLFWTTSACGFMAYLHYKHLIQRGIIPLKEMADLTEEFLNTPTDFVPGMKKLRFRDFPSFARTTDVNDTMSRFVLRETSRLYRASAIILNTFDELERPVLEAMAPVLPTVYSIGPLSLLVNQLPSDTPLASMSSSLWKEDTTCLDWLEGKDPGSIVYVNFGSITVMTNEQMGEFAWGLANSEREFLWVIRPDLVRGDHAMLPEEFLAATSGRSLIASWCNQEAVLLHPAVGGFLTHSGWNSTLESISAGVPMLCWPFFAEQPTNCRYACAEWGIGMEIGGNVKREEVEASIRELMSGEKGKEMKRRAVALKEAAAEAADVKGSSRLNLERMINEVLLADKSVAA